MKNQLIEILSKYNSREFGIILPMPVESYVDKIYSLSTIIPYFVQGQLIAFISFYNNDLSKTHSYLTMILVSQDYAGKGIGKLLLEMSIKELERSGFKYYSLEVLKTNSAAIQLYLNNGFLKKEDRGETWIMEKIL